MIVLTVQKATGAGVVSFTAPVSGEIIRATTTIGGFLSSDPTLTGAESTTPLADGVKTNVLLMFANSGCWNSFDSGNAPVISAGESLYLCAAGKGTVVLYISTPE